MRAFLFLSLFLSSQVGICWSEQPTLQDEYLTTYLILSYSDRIERQGYTSLACTMYSDCLGRLIALHEKADLEANEFASKVGAMRAKIAEMKSKLGDSDPPPPIDTVYKEFLKLALTADQSKQVNVNVDLSNWMKFQDEHPHWQSRLITKFIHDDREVLDRAKADQQPESHR